MGHIILFTHGQCHSSRYYIATSTMPDPLSLMLDSMILAVDEGHSYDGIVSLPGIGLEDFGRRPGRLGGWLDDCMVRSLFLSPTTISDDWVMRFRSYFGKSSRE